jgi:hypothetical protein
LYHHVVCEEPNILQEHTALLLNPEDGGDIFRQNVRLSLNDMALQLKRTTLFEADDICKGNKRK